MKKNLLLFISAIAAFTASAQVSIPNGNFENWTSATYDYPQGYTENSNPQTYFQCQSPFNVTKSTDSYSGMFALKMETTASAMDTCFAFIANPSNGNTSNGPSSWTGGFPMSEKPTGLRGYYKYNTPSGDSAGILVIARAGGSSIGMYLIPLGGLHTSYTLFNYTFSPALSVIPDSIILAFVSSNPMASSASVVPGSIALFDSISFTGITSQPATMNGDFEAWSSQTIENPNSWYMGSDRGQGVAKTTDKVGGNYAIELQTYLGDNNGVPRAQGGYVSTGYWDQGCNCQIGGFPFTNIVDTLAFYYKYLPVAGDSAEVGISFKSGGVNFFYDWRSLHASPSYQYMEIPFNVFGGTPDSVIISIQSSMWQDSSVVFVGSDLKIDEMHFKSQPLMTGFVPLRFTNDISFFPNPFKTTGTIRIGADINTSGMVVTIYDVTGRVVKRIETNEHKVSVDRTDMVNGIYFYEVKTNNGVLKTGKIVVE